MRSVKVALVFAIIGCIGAVITGDSNARMIARHQPAKLAAIEGHWQNHPGEGVPFTVFALPDMEAQANRYAVEIPRLGSLLLTHSWEGQFPALKDFAPEDRPPVAVVFWTFRVMVGLGVLMIALGAIGAWLRWRNRLHASRPFLRFALLMGPAGLVAILAGWFTTEIGRQPWIVYGLMRTADAASPLGGREVGFSLALFVLVYFLVFGAGTRYMLRLIGRGPVTDEGRLQDHGGPGQARQPMRPLSGADEGPAPGSGVITPQEA